MDSYMSPFCHHLSRILFNFVIVRRASDSFGPQFSAVDPGDKEFPEEVCPPTNTKISQAWRLVLFFACPWPQIFEVTSGQALPLFL